MTDRHWKQIYQFANDKFLHESKWFFTTSTHIFTVKMWVLTWYLAIFGCLSFWLPIYNNFRQQNTRNLSLIKWWSFQHLQRYFIWHTNQWRMTSLHKCETPPQFCWANTFFENSSCCSFNSFEISVSNLLNMIFTFFGVFYIKVQQFSSSISNFFPFQKAKAGKAPNFSDWASL